MSNCLKWNRTSRKAHVILALVHKLVLVLLVVEEFLVSNVFLTVWTRPTRQHTTFQKHSCKANIPIIRTVHQQYWKQDKMFVKLIYVSLRSRQREVHEKRSYNAKVMIKTGFPKALYLINSNHEIKKFQTWLTVAPTCSLWNYEANAIWMGQFGVKTTIL